jgi:hypothetical protein
MRQYAFSSRLSRYTRAYFTSPSTFPLSLPLPGRPKRSANR